MTCARPMGSLSTSKSLLHCSLTRTILASGSPTTPRRRPSGSSRAFSRSAGWFRADLGHGFHVDYMRLYLNPPNKLSTMISVWWGPRIDDLCLGRDGHACSSFIEVDILAYLVRSRRTSSKGLRYSPGMSEGFGPRPSASTGCCIPSPISGLVSAAAIVDCRAANIGTRQP